MLLFLILLWIVCGIIAAGFYFNDLTLEFKEIAGSTQRGNLAHAIGMGLLGGPIGLVLSFFLTGFWKHGWRLKFYSREQCLQWHKERYKYIEPDF